MRGLCLLPIYCRIISGWKIPRHYSWRDHCNCIPHSTPHHNKRPSFQRPTQLRPNWPVASAHTVTASQVHSAATESFLCSDTLSRDCPLYPVYRCCFKNISAFLDNTYNNTVRRTMHHLRPPARKPTYVSSIEDESGSWASPAMLL